MPRHERACGEGGERESQARNDAEVDRVHSEPGSARVVDLDAFAQGQARRTGEAQQTASQGQRDLAEQGDERGGEQGRDEDRHGAVSGSSLFSPAARTPP